MTEPRLFTILRGAPHNRPVVPDTSENLSCYTTDDAQLLLILPGRRAEAAAGLGATMGVAEPTIAICDHYCTITADPDEPSLGPDSGDKYQVWIELATGPDQQRLLADFNIAETASAIRHLPGFRSASFFLQHDRPVVHEHVVWRSEQDLAFARQQPGFTRHLPFISEVATASWRSLTPLPRNGVQPGVIHTDLEP
ncbi:antibiotic biosynthesis monooxygenase [Nocardia pneumoniae]|uniref:antibiotic biosynthesis monooxygenase n=1 Tax=Nocardia pneumoniae TaxID=228601 RepID=UPI0002D9AA81|nr:antibiotic biosynthesis monooxygenase [Nocardia pneumoniae]